MLAYGVHFSHTWDFWLRLGRVPLEELNILVSMLTSDFNSPIKRIVRRTEIFYTALSEGMEMEDGGESRLGLRGFHFRN